MNGWKIVLIFEGMVGQGGHVWRDDIAFMHIPRAGEYVAGLSLCDDGGGEIKSVEHFVDTKCVAIFLSYDDGGKVAASDIPEGWNVGNDPLRT